MMQRSCCIKTFLDFFSRVPLGGTRLEIFTPKLASTFNQSFNLARSVRETISSRIRFRCRCLSDCSGYDYEEIEFQSGSALSKIPRVKSPASSPKRMSQSFDYFREIFKQTFLAFRKQAAATAGISPSRGLSGAILPIDGIPERLRCAGRPETSAHYQNSRGTRFEFGREEERAARGQMRLVLRRVVATHSK